MDVIRLVPQPRSPGVLLPTLLRWIPALFVAALLTAALTACGGNFGSVNERPTNAAVSAATPAVSITATDMPASTPEVQVPENIPESAQGNVQTTGKDGDPTAAVSADTSEAAATTGPAPTATATATTQPAATKTPEPTLEPGQISHENDREALIALYHATDGPGWVNNDNWLSDRPLSEWYGVTTDRFGRVTELQLQNNRVGGELPAELGQLTKLRRLLLHRDFWHSVAYSNPIVGAIPAELGLLSDLEELNLTDNELIGEIPAELGQLSNLKELLLANNDLSGEIPAELGRLLNLTRLHLARNDMNGKIPTELGQLSNLKELDLSYNDLSGEIPDELGKLSFLEALYLYRNNLNGCVPDGLKDVEGNDFDELVLPFCAALAEAMATDRAVLVAFYHATDGPDWINSDHWLSDTPLDEWYGVTTDRRGHVIELHLHDNRVGGTIPSELSQLARLEELSLSDNQLTGEIPADLGLLSNLEELSLSNNKLAGAIPIDLGQLSSLLWMNLDDNQLNGSVPAELGRLSNLLTMDLENNQLSGTIPGELGQLSRLAVLRLAGNELSGCVPDALKGLRYNDFDELGLPFCTP